MRRTTRWYMPWWVLAVLGKVDVWCWAELVAWKVAGGRFANRNTRCAFRATRDGKMLTCYCGFWDHDPVTCDCPSCVEKRPAIRFASAVVSGRSNE